MTHADKVFTLASLASLSIDDINGMVLSAFEGNDIDKEYIQKNKNVYSALLEKETFMVVYNRVKSESEGLGDKLKALQSALTSTGIVTVTEGNLPALIQQMKFKDTAKPTFAPEPDEPEVEIPADAAYEIMQNVRLVMSAYKELYGTVFDPLRPKGAFSMNPKHNEKYGVILHNTAQQGKAGNDSKVTPSSIAMNRVSALYEAMLGDSVLMDSTNVSAEELGARGGYYFPAQAGRFASGTIKSEGVRYPSRKKFEEALNKWVYGKLSKVYDFYKSKGDEVCLGALQIAAYNLATAFVVAEFDASVSNLLVFKVCAPAVTLCTNKDLLQKAFDSRKLIGVQVRGVHLSEGEPNDFPVYTVTVALNGELERKAPMYAYQIWDAIAEGSGKISEELGTHNIVFGRKFDGSMQTFDMARHNGNAYHNMTVVAMSRSGKGLTTLATLAAAAAHGEPIFYLDCKPDMMAMLQKYMASVGQPSHLFAYDALGEESGGTGKMRVPIEGSDAARYKHYEFPFDFNEFGTDQELFGAYIFAKAMTLLLAMMSFAPSDEKERWAALGYDCKNGLLAVFDELEKVQLQHWDSFIKLVRSEQLKNEKEGKGANAQKTARAEYVTKLASVVNELIRGIEAADKALLQRSPVATLSLFQTIGYVTGNRSAFKGIFGKSALVGNMDTGGASKEIINGISADTKRAFSARQWYVYPNAVKGLSTSELKKPVKPFLVFNTPADVDGYLNSDPVFNSLPHEFKQGVIANKSKMHFVGLLDAYGVKLSDSLSKGYDIIQNFLNLAGFNGTVDDFVLSAQSETLIPYTELAKRAIAGLNGLAEGADASSLNQQRNTQVEGDLSDDFIDDLNSMGGSAEVAQEVVNAEFEDSLASHEEYGAPEAGEIINDATDDDAYGDVRNELQDTESIMAQQSENPTQPAFYPEGQAAKESRQEPTQETVKHVEQSPHANKRPLFYFNDVPFTQDDEGNYHYAAGRFAPPQNVKNGVFNGQSYTTHPVVDIAPPAFTRGEHGVMNVSDPRMVQYAQPLNGTEVGFKGKLKPITPTTSVAKLEKALAQRWFILMQAGGRQVGNAGLVTHVSIGENYFIVNDMPVYATESIIGDSGIRISHLVNFAELFSYYKNLKQLDLDYPTRIAFGVSYSNPAIPFTQSKVLQLINFTDANGRTIAFGREQAAQKLNIPEDRLNARYNTWSGFTARVNRGSGSAFCKPGNKLVMANLTKRMAAGAFGTNTTWSKPRRAFGVVGMLLCGAGTIVTGGVQAARSIKTQYK